MITDRCQRWLGHRSFYRPAGEVIDPRGLEVATIDDDTTAKAFVVAHHYSRSYTAARWRFGLYRGAELVGVAVFGVPVQPRALDVLPGSREESVDLGRFVLLDEVEANGESWFLARCFEALRRDGVVGVVSFSDPTPRIDAEGLLVHHGHVGTIYQATNATYLGRSKAESVLLLPDGTCLHRRALVKIHKRERGWRYVVAKLEALGAERFDGSNLVAWAELVLPGLVRRVRHGGNHKYAWALLRRDRRHLPASLPYPKVPD